MEESKTHSHLSSICRSLRLKINSACVLPKTHSLKFQNKKRALRKERRNEELRRKANLLKHHHTQTRGVVESILISLRSIVLSSITSRINVPFRRIEYSNSKKLSDSKKTKTETQAFNSTPLSDCIEREIRPITHLVTTEQNNGYLQKGPGINNLYFNI